MTTDPLVKVARDLRLIVDMTARLEAQAIAKANDALMPGGLAMVALAGVASYDEYGEQLEAAEHQAIAGRRTFPEIEDSDDDWIPPLQSLLFWSEAWRDQHGYPLPARPTEATEANFLRWALEWAWDNEPHWDDFAGDVRKARARMEALLMEGERVPFRGVPCPYTECRGVRIIRKLVPGRDEDGEKVWRLTDWHCPRCKRSWDEKRYSEFVTALHEQTKVELVGYQGETWCSIDYAARKVGRTEATIRVWLHRGELQQLCIVSGRRKPFVRLADVETLDRQKARRGRRSA